jgi:hypothetical protein
MYSEPLWIGQRIRDITELADGTIALSTDDSLLFLTADKERLASDRHRRVAVGEMIVSSCIYCHHFGPTVPSDPGAFVDGSGHPPKNAGHKRTIVLGRRRASTKSSVSFRIDIDRHNQDCCTIATCHRTDCRVDEGLWPIMLQKSDVVSASQSVGVSSRVDLGERRLSLGAAGGGRGSASTIGTCRFSANACPM